MSVGSILAGYWQLVTKNAIRGKLLGSWPVVYIFIKVKHFFSNEFFLGKRSKG